MTPTRTTCRPGLGLVELLVALAITAMLLTSVAVAFQASLDTVSQNQDIATATQSARLVLHRVVDEVRRSVDVQATTDSIAILPPDDGSGLLMTQYYLENGVLYYARVIADAKAVYPILGLDDGVVVHAFWITHQTGLDGDGQVCTKSLTARLDLEVGNNRQAITASTVIRRNMDW